MGEWGKADFWKQPLVAFQNDFWVMLPLFALVIWAAWWVRGKVNDREVGGLKGEISVKNGEISFLDRQLKDAKELTAASGQTGSELRDELRGEFKTEIETLKIRMGDMADKAEIAAALSTLDAKIDAKIDVGFAKLATSNAAVSHVLSPGSATVDLRGVSSKFGVGTFGQNR